MNSGRISLDEVLAACENAGTIREPITASEVAEQLGCTRRAALNKLGELAERGDLRSKKVGARSRVWWQPTDPSYSDGRATRDRDDTDDAHGSPPAEGEESFSHSSEYERLKAELDEVFGRISDGFYALDDQWRFTYVSERAEELTGSRGMNLVGKNIWEVFDDVADTKLSEEYRTAMETQEPTFFEVYDEELDAWYEVHAYPSETGLSVYFRDVTEQREAQRKLRESEAKFQMLAENLDEIVWMATPNAEEFIYINPAFEEIWGLDREELYDEPLSFLEAVHPDDRDRVREAFAALPESDFDEEFQIVRPDGEDRWVHARGTEVYGNDGEMTRIVGIGKDVSERKEHDRELERALDLLDRTQRIADVGGWEIDVNTEDVFWTDHIFELLEVTADEEPPLDEALSMYYEEDQSIVEDAAEKALASGDPFDEEVRIRTDSGDMRWLRLQGVPETVDGEVVSFRGAAQDVTERIERERELEERNERLDSFASMLAHELRNPVTIGQIYSQQLPTETDSEAVSYVTEAFDRIEDMIDVLLVLTRGHEAISERRSVQLADAAHDAWDKVEASEATLGVELDRTIQSDETYIQHLFRNLFENAVEHGGADVTITVGGLPTGFYVADDGSGIRAEERDAIFEAGYTTAAEQGGTGLGLAFVQKLADVCEWEYAVTESANGGARFEFTNVDQDSPRN